MQRVAGQNSTIKWYLSIIDKNNVRSLAAILQQETSAHREADITAVWIEAVLIELNKKDLLMKFKGD